MHHVGIGAVPQGRYRVTACGAPQAHEVDWVVLFLIAETEIIAESEAELSLGQTCAYASDGAAPRRDRPRRYRPVTGVSGQERVSGRK